MENVQKMSGWFSHQRHETSETQPKRQEKNEILVKWRNLCVCECKYGSSCDEMKILSRYEHDTKLHF